MICVETSGSPETSPAACSDVLSTVPVFLSLTLLKSSLIAKPLIAAGSIFFLAIGKVLKEGWGEGERGRGGEGVKRGQREGRKSGWRGREGGDEQRKLIWKDNTPGCTPLQMAGPSLA